MTETLLAGEVRQGWQGREQALGRFHAQGKFAKADKGASKRGFGSAHRGRGEVRHGR